jgi:ATP-binding cassette subfamily B protein RaxB
MSYRYNFYNSLILAIDKIAYIYFGSLFVLDATITVGVFVTFVLYKEIIIETLSSFFETLLELKKADIEIKEANGLLETLEVDSQNNTQYVPYEKTLDSNCTVAASFIFKYPGDRSTGFQCVDFFAVSGEKILIYGPSGSGKSTFAKILYGFLTPTTGDVVLAKSDGTQLLTNETPNISDYISYHSTTDALLSGSIYFNVSLTYDTSEENVKRFKEVCISMSIYDEIESLPQKEHTHLFALSSGQGILSTGQIKRILLARAVYSRTDVLILDEPTANLDEQNTENIFRCLREMSCTVICMTHSKIARKHFDNVYEVKDGVLSGAPCGRMVVPPLI